MVTMKQEETSLDALVANANTDIKQDEVLARRDALVYNLKIAFGPLPKKAKYYYLVFYSAYFLLGMLAMFWCAHYVFRHVSFANYCFIISIVVFFFWASANTVAGFYNRKMKGHFG